VAAIDVFRRGPDRYFIPRDGARVVGSGFKACAEDDDGSLIVVLHISASVPTRAPAIAHTIPANCRARFRGRQAGASDVDLMTGAEDVRGTQGSARRPTSKARSVQRTSGFN